VAKRIMKFDAGGRKRALIATPQVRRPHMDSKELSSVALLMSVGFHMLCFFLH